MNRTLLLTVSANWPDSTYTYLIHDMGMYIYTYIIWAGTDMNCMLDGRRVPTLETTLGWSDTLTPS